MAWWDDAPKVDAFDVALQAEGLTGKAADVARSIYQQESGGGRNTKTSNAGAVGGMQIVPATFASVADKGWDINDPVANARAGIRYVKQGFEAAGGDPALTGAFYYGGPGGLAKARQGVAVSDPRNPNAPTTLQYGQQVAARVPKERGLVQRAVEGMLPSANAAEAPGEQWWASAPVVKDEPAPAEKTVNGDRPSVRIEVNGTSADEPGLFNQIAGAGAQQARNLGGGLIRGAGSIGATLLAPVDAAARAMGVDPNGAVGSIVGRTDRRQAMDAALGQLGSDTGSIGYGAGKIGAEIAGTAGVGGAVAAPLRAVPALNRLATSIGSAGMTVGPGGNMLANLGTRAAGGAVTGGASAGLVNPEDVGVGAAIGAALPPVAVGAARAGGAIGGAARAARDTMTRAGQDRIAETVLRRSATNPDAAATALANAREIVPGSVPTVGQAAADPGLAQLERTMLNNPATAPALNTRYAQQRAARAAAVDDVAATAPGSGSYYDDIVEGRNVFAREDYNAARAAGVDQEMAASMQPEIASLMERPSIQNAVADAKRLAKETGENIDEMGSVQGLDWLKKSIDNQISKAQGPNSAIGKADLTALQNTSRDLNSVLEQLSPKYLEANRNYAQMSKQINSMDVARDLERRYTPAAAEYGQSAQENGAAYMKALRSAQDSVKGATGRNMALGDAMSTADIAKLEDVARDLARKQYSQEAGRAVGSPTAQNLVSQNFIQQIMQDAGLPMSGAADSTLLNTLLRPIQFAGRLAEPNINNRLAELIANPQAAAEALRRLPLGGPRNALANSLLLQNSLRAAPVIGSQ